jgi:Protein of unknown function (DUF2637)
MLSTQAEKHHTTKDTPKMTTTNAPAAHPTVGDRIVRAATAAVVVGIGAVAGYVSYRHAYEVVTAHGESGATARLVPFTIDGLVFVAGMVARDAARRGHDIPTLARVAMVLGILATLAVNVLHGMTAGLIGAVIAAWPAVTLVLAMELVMMLIRGTAHQPAAVEAAEVALDAAPELVPESAAPTLAEEVAEQLTAARHHFADALAKGIVPAIRDIKNGLGISQPRARLLWAHLTLAADAAA